MKTNKNFTEKIVETGFILLGIVLILLFTQTYEINYLMFIALLSVAYIVFDLVISRRKEKEDPLSVKNIHRALDFAISRKRGSKDEFIHEFCEEMYNFLVENGLIHELLACDDEPLDAPKNWEVTKRGIIKFQQK